MPVLPEVGSMMTEPSLSLVQVFFDMLELEQRGLADELICGSINLRHNDLLFICQNVM